MTTIALETIAIIRGADDSKTLAARLGAGAVVALAEDIFPSEGGKIAHGFATEVAAILKDGGIGAARAKYYSEKSVQVCKAILHTCLIQRAKGRTQAEKDEIFSAAKAAAFAELASLSSVPTIQAWCRKQLPAKDDTPPVAAPAPAPAPAPVEEPVADAATGAASDSIDAAFLAYETAKREDAAAKVFQLLAVFAAGVHAAQTAAAAAAKGGRKATLKAA